MGSGEQAGCLRMSDRDVLAASAGLARCSTLKVGSRSVFYSPGGTTGAQRTPAWMLLLVKGDDAEWEAVKNLH